MTTAGPSVARGDILARDGWKCGLCGLRIDPSLTGHDKMGATLDHIIPLSRGGRHVAENLQAAHMICNATKKDGLNGAYRATA